MATRKPVALDDLSAMLVFLRVVEAGSLSSAARALGTTTSAVSKRVSALEGRLGARLLHRTTRKLAMTDAGRVLREHATELLASVEAAERAVMGLGDAPRGVVRVSGPVTFGQLHLAALVADFLRAHPEVRVELALSDRHVDVVGEHFDLAIRSGRLADSGLVARKLAPDRRVVCGAPDYLARRGVPATPRDLARHDCMRHAYNNASGTWSFEGPEGPESVRVRGSFQVNHGGAIREAALRGLGLALLPHFVVRDDLRSGALVQVLEPYALPRGAIYALMPGAATASRATRALVDFLAERLPARLE